MKRTFLALLVLAAAGIAQDVFIQYTSVIASGASLGAEMPATPGAPVGLQMPAAWTAAVVTFQCSFDNVTYANLYDDGGNEITVTAVAGNFVTLSGANFAGCKYIKPRSGTNSVPVNQGAARTLTFVTRR